MSVGPILHDRSRRGRVLELVSSESSLLIYAVSGEVDYVVGEEELYCCQSEASDCQQLVMRSDFLYSVLTLPDRYGCDDWDGNGALPLSAASFENAVSFANRLPSSLPPPRVLVDPDGDVCFKWNRSRYDKVEVTFSCSGEYYAIIVIKGMKRSSFTNSRYEITSVINQMLGE